MYVEEGCNLTVGGREEEEEELSQEREKMVASSPPYRLVASVASEAMGIGKSSEVLTVLGGKASCRRKFVLNVHLLDDNGNLATNNKDISIVASVAYAHDHCPVVRDDKPFLAEPPLFTTFNGVEFPAAERPTRMVSGRASFKLAISLLSSKCDNRLFCICFTPQFPPDVTPICGPCYSKPIRSISRKRTQSTPLTIPVPADPHHHHTGASPVSPKNPNSPLSLRLSPNPDSSSPNPESGSPNSGTLTSESCCNKDSQDPVSPVAVSTTRPFRPYASVGACNLPLSDLHLQGLSNRSPSALGHEHSSLLERVQRLRSVSPTSPTNVGGSFSGFNGGNSAGGGKMNEVSLEEEEKSLQYIEVSLQEVNRELQRRKEELRSKRRKILEEDARSMHSIIFQSSSWIESLSSRFSL